jgi:hypothetical protein
MKIHSKILLYYYIIRRKKLYQFKANDAILEIIRIIINQIILIY